MITLDTDHLTVLRYADNPRCGALRTRLETSGDPELAVTAISLEEQLRGWLAEIKRCRDFLAEIPIYERLIRMVAFYGEWTILPLDRAAADQCRLLKKQVRIGTKDLKIAATALSRNAMLLSANLRGFRKVPGLRVEDWIH